jgi:Uma2 family endonuclease
MAALPNPAYVPVEEYLNSSYSPDAEYVDGTLVDRGMPTLTHGIFQILLGVYFHAYRKQYRYAVLSEARTRIVQGLRYRLPDIMLCPVPLPTGKIVTTIPWAVIEILSPSDQLQAQLERFRDYAQLGVRHIVLLDPERLIAYRYEDDSLIKTQFSELTLPTGSLPFNTEALFRQLVEELNEGRESAS